MHFYTLLAGFKGITEAECLTNKKCCYDTSVVRLFQHKQKTYCLFNFSALFDFLYSLMPQSVSTETVYYVTDAEMYLKINVKSVVSKTACLDDRNIPQAPQM